jgi:hypothetical protein
VDNIFENFDKLMIVSHGLLYTCDTGEIKDLSEGTEDDYQAGKHGNRLLL